MPKPPTFPHATIGIALADAPLAERYAALLGDLARIRIAGSLRESWLVETEVVLLSATEDAARTSQLERATPRVIRVGPGDDDLRVKAEAEYALRLWRVASALGGGELVRADPLALAEAAVERWQAGPEGLGPALAHELRTPLATLRLQASRLLRQDDLHPRVAEIARTIDRASRRLAEGVEVCLAGNDPGECPEAFSVEHAVRQACKAAQGTAREKDVDILLGELADPYAQRFGARRAFGGLLRALLAHAAGAAPSGAQVRVSAEYDAGGCHVRVEGSEEGSVAVASGALLEAARTCARRLGGSLLSPVPGSPCTVRASIPLNPSTQR